jgi:hypothetical protein
MKVKRSMQQDAEIQYHTTSMLFCYASRMWFKLIYLLSMSRDDPCRQSYTRTDSFGVRFVFPEHKSLINHLHTSF